MLNFTLYPAIDLRAGSVVRLVQGDPSRTTVYSKDPRLIAKRWISEGARWLHVVDLDAALGDATHANLEAIQVILSTGVKVQFGGGLRSEQDVERAFDLGVERVVLGTLAIQAPDQVGRMLAKHGSQRIAVAIDSRDGIVHSHGWTEGSSLSAIQFGQQMRTFGVTQAIHTDISRDGLSRGVNVESSVRLAQETGLQVVASGGVSSLTDIRAVQAAGLAGVIVGRSLYEGYISLQEALAC